MLRRLSPSWVFGALSAAMAAGYGVLFTVVGDFRDAYGISETAIGFVIGIGFIAAFFAQVFIAPIAALSPASASGAPLPPSAVS